MRWIVLVSVFALAADSSPGAPDSIPKPKKSPREEAGGAGEKKETGPGFAFLCTAGGEIAADKKIKAEIVKWFDLKDASEIEEYEGPGVDEDGEEVPGLSFTVRGKSYIAVLAPVPVPKPDIEYACGNAFLWRDAAEEMKKQRAHFIVTALGDFDSPAEQALGLSRAIAALSACHDSVGIFWGHASVVHEPEMFRRSVERASLEMGEIPALLWVGFLRARDEDGGVDIYTDGLDAFGLKELEVVGSKKLPSEILEVLYGLCQYTIAKGDVIKDGDTVGGTEEEKIKTRFAPSEIGREGTVLRVDL